MLLYNGTFRYCPSYLTTRINGITWGIFSFTFAIDIVHSFYVFDAIGAVGCSVFGWRLGVGVAMDDSRTGRGKGSLRVRRTGLHQKHKQKL